ncbi:putative amino acid transporter [Trypanosoma cruzi]|uniref:Putative amino acid transporter n=1 Tax=Trypanosoma cruzi TaxID=5693 RepID=A0A2V2UGR9_TRYCR|nr:putative amino acid transporter [Trypanosoma cruzi]
MFFSTIPPCSANTAYRVTIGAEPPMHHSITDEGIHLFGTGNRALDGLGVFMFAFLCQVNSFEVYWDMSDRSASRFTLCSAIAMLLCFIVYGSTQCSATLTSAIVRPFPLYSCTTPVKEPEVVVAYIGLLVKLCASFPLISMATRNSLYHSVGWDPDKLPFWKHWRRRRQSCRCCTALRPVHPQYQHWCLASLAHSVEVQRGFFFPPFSMMYGATGRCGQLDGRTHHHIRAALCRCRHGGVWAQVHHLRRCGGRLSAAQCGAPARLRIHGRQQACGVLLQDFAAVLGTLGAM